MPTRHRVTFASSTDYGSALLSPIWSHLSGAERQSLTLEQTSAVLISPSIDINVYPELFAEECGLFFIGLWRSAFTFFTRSEMAKGRRRIVSCERARS